MFFLWKYLILGVGCNHEMVKFEMVCWAGQCSGSNSWDGMLHHAQIFTWSENCCLPMLPSLLSRSGPSLVGWVAASAAERCDWLVPGERGSSSDGEQCQQELSWVWAWLLMISQQVVVERTALCQQQPFSGQQLQTSSENILIEQKIIGRKKKEKGKNIIHKVSNKSSLSDLIESIEHWNWTRDQRRVMADSSLNGVGNESSSSASQHQQDHNQVSLALEWE